MHNITLCPVEALRKRRMQGQYLPGCHSNVPVYSKNWKWVGVERRGWHKAVLMRANVCWEESLSLKERYDHSMCTVNHNSSERRRPQLMPNHFDLWLSYNGCWCILHTPKIKWEGLGRQLVVEEWTTFSWAQTVQMFTRLFSTSIIQWIIKSSLWVTF